MTEYNKKNPFPAKIIQRYVLNKEGSTKKTYHITLDLTGSKMAYRAGDSLAIFPKNLLEDVHTLLAALNKSGDEKVTDPRSGSSCTLKHFLTAKVNMNRIR